MKRAIIYLLLIAIAVALAGIYGMVHNQISYTVSPEYFTKFKFRQFGIVDMPLTARAKASLVGFLASWWMGIPIGLLAGASGFIHKTAARMLRQTLKAYLVLVGFTLFVGLCGLSYGYFNTGSINLVEYRYWYIPEDLLDTRRFLCAGYMHNSSYLGGVLGIGAAWVYQIIAKRRERSPA